LVSIYDTIDANNNDLGDVLVGPICIAKDTPVPSEPQLAAWTFQETYHGGNCSSDFKSYHLMKGACQVLDASSSYTETCSDGLITGYKFNNPNCDNSAIESSWPVSSNHCSSGRDSEGTEESTSRRYCTVSSTFGTNLNLTVVMPDKKLMKIR
jgi:hypothetical protein